MVTPMKNRRRLVLSGVGIAGLLVAAALALVVAPAAVGGRDSPDLASTRSGPAQRGCHVVSSVYGYPTSYIARRANTRFTRRYPVAGWRSPGRALDFDVLFHSVFHGYLVITYPLDLQPAKRAELRRWVLSRRGERVVATPTRVPGASWFDAAEWGWELRCTRVVPTSAALDQFAARRRI
jgi:hypothetical protein